MFTVHALNTNLFSKMPIQLNTIETDYKQYDTFLTSCSGWLLYVALQMIQFCDQLLIITTQSPKFGYISRSAVFLFYPTKTEYKFSSKSLPHCMKEYVNVMYNKKLVPVLLDNFVPSTAKS